MEGSMTGYIGKRFMRLLLFLAAVSAASFFLLSLSPVDPLKSNVGQAALGSMSQDRLITAWCMVTAGTPAFWLAMMLLMLLAVRFPVFPIGFSLPVGMAAQEATLADRLSHAFLPALALGLTGVSNIAMHTRSKMIEVMESDYICYARARGERGWRLIRRHGLRGLMLPAITLQFGSISEIFGGSVLVEAVFSYPGLGQAAVTAGLGGDAPLLMGITLISAVLVFTGNFAADLLYLAADPRMRAGTGRKGGGRHVHGGS